MIGSAVRQLKVDGGTIVLTATKSPAFSRSRTVLALTGALFTALLETTTQSIPAFGSWAAMI